MIELPNNCRCSDLVVFPKNWKTISAKTSIYWYIGFRFYDPTQRAKYPKGKQVLIKGMNDTYVLAERRKKTQDLLNELHHMLTEEGYNPISKKIIQPVNESNIVTEVKATTPFIEALKYSLTKQRWTHKVIVDAESILRYTEEAVRRLKYTNVSISVFSSAHFMELMDMLFKVNPRFSNYRHNKYLKCYTGLYKKLIQYKVVSGNVPKGIDKLVETKRIRKTLTDEERKTVSEYLYTYNRPFWKFVQIFFHSGGREAELMLLRGENINLKEQKYTCIVKKGRQHAETERTIKDVALPFWEEQMQNCGKHDYVFARDLLPGKIPIDPAQIGKRWLRWVKEPLGITADLYSLKHTNASETADVLSDEDTAKQMGHTTTKMLKTYDTRRKKRQHDRLKSVSNQF